MRLRWSVQRAVLKPSLGHEQAGTRPIMIISNEPFNLQSGLVTAIPLTSARRPAQPWEVFLPGDCCGLPQDSLALAQHVRTLSVSRLRPPAYGRLTDADLRRQIADRVLEHLRFHDLARLRLET